MNYDALIDRAENLFKFMYIPAPFNTLINDLLVALKKSRREVRCLDLSIKEEVANLTPEEQAEHDALFKEFRLE